MFTDAKMSLCNSHDTITYWNRGAKRDIKAYVKKHPESEPFLCDALDYINRSIEETRLAKKKGQRMENRLRAYFNACISLGFKRV